MQIREISSQQLLNVDYRNGNWIQTYGSRKFYPFDPRPEDIDIRDIAHALSMICRFNGHVRDFYSVAQHSIQVASECSIPNQLWGLLHDASEAYICDLASPIKHSNKLKEYRSVEKNIMKCVATKFSLPWPVPQEVKNMDLRACVTEARDYLSPLLPGWELDAEPFPVHWDPLSPKDAENLFLEMWKVLNWEVLNAN